VQGVRSIVGALSDDKSSPPPGLALNVGCGRRYRDDWINLDLQPASPEVMAWDVREPLPFASNSIAFAYTSHMLEHLPENHAGTLLAELHRVLVPGGTVRVVVPDLELIARWYIEAIEAKGAPGYALEWSRLHLLDQLVRRTSGGSMKTFLRDASTEAFNFAARRLGSEALGTQAAARQPTSGMGALARLRSALRAPGLPGRFRVRVGLAVGYALVRCLLGARGPEALTAGWFATSGEQHQWMYDEISLRRIVEHAGFSRVSRQTAATSGWTGWGLSNLDVDPQGTIYKPESIYLEGTKRNS
jgi:predicted SAM-dependent methyltransferase